MSRTEPKRVSTSTEWKLIGPEELRRTVSEVLHEQAPSLQVLGVTGQQEEDRVEIFIAIRECRVEPCILMVLFHGEVSPTELRVAIVDRLREHFVEHPPLQP
jgi:hypothetical protein